MYLPGERVRGLAGVSEPLMGQTGRRGQRGRPIGDPRRSGQKTRRSIWKTEWSIWKTERSIRKTQRSIWLRQLAARQCRLPIWQRQLAAPAEMGGFPCGGGRVALYGGLGSPVRGFGFPCTSGAPYPDGGFSLPYPIICKARREKFYGFCKHRRFLGAFGGEIALAWRVLKPLGAFYARKKP